jgi:hypothetical protein
VRPIFREVSRIPIKGIVVSVGELLDSNLLEAAITIFLSKSHIYRSATLTVTCLLLALGLAACGSSAKRSAGTQSSQTRLLDTQKVALAIELSVLHQRDLHAQVFCPSRVPQLRGQSFTCLAYAPKVMPAAFTVTQVNQAGDVQYSSE